MNSLISISKQKEMSVREESRQYRKLRERVILHLVDHDISSVALTPTHEGQLQIEPLNRIERLLAKNAHANPIEA